MSSIAPRNTILGGTNYNPQLISHSKPQRFKVIENKLLIDSTEHQINPLSTRLDLRDSGRFTTTANDIGKLNERLQENKFAPQNVQNVLRYYSFYIETIDESNLETIRLRKNTIFLYLHDETFEVIEPRIMNSGLPQGTYLKRCKLMKPDGNTSYGVQDLYLGVDFPIFGRVFTIYDCDSYTREYYHTYNLELGEVINLPKDTYTISREEITRLCGGDHNRFYGKVRYPLKTFMEASLGNSVRSVLQSEKKRKFLAYNRKVLCFHCEIDTRNELYGSLLHYTLDYFLEDDTIEVNEVLVPNSGRDPFPIYVRRSRLLKDWTKVLEDDQDRGVETPYHREAYYNEEDLYVGASIIIFGRNVKLVDADRFTRDYYSQTWGRTLSDPCPTLVEKPDPPIHTIPPHNGYGTEEDSLGSCKLLCPKPPRKDLKKMAKYDRMLLRFSAKLIATRKEQAQRRFILTFFLADDTLSIYEPEQRNSGIVNGKFLERGTYKTPNGVKYTVDHLNIGSELTVNSYQFQILDADEYTKNYLEQL